FIRFLLRWQHVTPDTRREGSRGVLAVVEQLQGFELAAGAWEKEIFPARVTGYRREWLDEVCLDGGVAWGRLSIRDDSVKDDPGGRLPRGPVAVRPPGGGAGHRVDVHKPPAPSRQPARRSARRPHGAGGRALVAAARARRRLRPGRPGRGGRRAADRALGRGF